MSSRTRNGAEPHTVFPQLELLTVSILRRPANTFWPALATATKPILRSGGPKLENFVAEVNLVERQLRV